MSLLVCLLSNSTACLQKLDLLVFCVVFVWTLKMTYKVGECGSLCTSGAQILLINQVHILIDGSFRRTNCNPKKPKIPSRIFFIPMLKLKKEKEKSTNCFLISFFLFLFLVFFTSFFCFFGHWKTLSCFPEGQYPCLTRVTHVINSSFVFWLSLDGFYKESHAGPDQLSNCNLHVPKVKLFSPS